MKKCPFSDGFPEQPPTDIIQTQYTYISTRNGLFNHKHTKINLEWINEFQNESFTLILTL